MRFGESHHLWNPDSVDYTYQRFQIERPQYLADSYWESVALEADRLWRALEAKDASQAIGYIKCLVEAIAKIVLDLDGTPAANTDKLPKVLPKAHRLLASQPGDELAIGSPFQDMANKAMGLTNHLAELRNNYGAGHGRSRQPDLNDEMVHMALDGGLMWARWALRRIGLFAIGRPTQLIEALIGPQSQNFTGEFGTNTNSLRQRLLAADLPNQDPKHQRSIGVAVGQRAATGTFMVQGDGVDECGASSDLHAWPVGYRIGVVSGLWVSAFGAVTITSKSISDAMAVLDPVPDCSGELIGLVDEVMSSGIVLSDREPADGIRQVGTRLLTWAQTRPPAETEAWMKLARYIAPDPWAL